MASYHLQETRPVFHFSPRTLQEMAASRCAFICWCHQINQTSDQSNPILNGSWEDRWFKEPISCNEIMPVPATIASIINHKIRFIREEVRKLMIHGQFQSVGITGRKAVVSCIVLNSAGDICYKRTAKNLLMENTTTFGSCKQFEIACTFCIEEVIERLSSVVKNSVEFRQFSFDFSSFRIRRMDYWCSRVRGELKESYGDEAKSPEWYVVSSLRYDQCFLENYAEFEYFWNKLNENEQSTLLSIIPWNRDFTTYLMLKLDDEVVKNLARSKSIDFMRNLAEDELFYEHALQLWNYVKNFIVEEPNIFYQILVDLSQMAFNQPHVASLLEEIWHSASDQLKDYVCASNEHVESFFEESLGGGVIVCSTDCNVGFYIELLRNTSSETRQRIWQIWWQKFVVTLAEPTNWAKLMTLCFDNADEIVEFKKNTMLDYDVLENIFMKFTAYDFYERFSEYLTFCCSDDDDEKRVRDARKKLVGLHINKIIQCDSKLTPITLKNLFQFMAGSFTAADLAELLDCEVADKLSGLLTLCILFNQGQLKLFAKIVKHMKLPVQRGIMLKLFFIKRCKYVSTSGDFISFFVRDWEVLLKWCMSVAKLMELKRSIQVDTLFDNFLINMHKFFMDCHDRNSFVAKYGYSHWVIFYSFDGFLRWYFGNYGPVTKYKSRKINDYENSETIKKLLEMENDDILLDVVRWFFDKNEDNVQDFLFKIGKKSCPIRDVIGADNEVTEFVGLSDGDFESIVGSYCTGLLF